MSSASRTSGRALALATLVLAGCTGDASTSVAPSALPIAPSPMTRLRGSVDLVQGTMTFTAPERSGFSSDARFALYGDQGLTVRLYNSGVTVVNPSRPGFKTYTANVGLRNLLAHSIGDEQSGPASDTLGLYVIFTALPSVSAPVPCAGCSVTITNPTGSAAFDAPNEPYFYWKDQLSAVNGGSDTTRTRKPWVFEASTGVTGFQFDVLVSAAWPFPHDSLWRADYSGDSLPNTQVRPPWSVRSSSFSGTISSASGSLTMTAPNGQLYYYARNDSIGRTSSVFAEARFRLTDSPNNGRPGAGLVIDDDTRFIALGVARSLVGFVDNQFGNFTGTTAAVTSGTNHVYQLRKFGGDSAQIWVDGARVLSRAYTSLPATSTYAQPSTFLWGVDTQAGATTAIWDYVTYQIGKPTP